MTSRHMEFKKPTRRDFLFVTTGAVAAVGVPFAAWPLIDQMNPDAAAVARAFVQVDLSDVAVGQSKLMGLEYRGFLVRHRTAKEIAAARATILSDLPDTRSRNVNAPKKDASDINRSVHADGRFLIVSPYCTFRGCELLTGKGRYNGWFCPCCGSHFDTSGRTRSGPAQENLVVPYFNAIASNVVEVVRAPRF